MTRGYVALNFSFDSRTDKVSCTAKKDMVIQGENGASVVLKAGQKFTAVRAASLGANRWYIVRDVTGEKKCSCPATKPCKHERHVATSKPLDMLRTEDHAKDRKVACTPVKAIVTEPVDNMTMQAVATEEYRMSNAVYEKLKATTKPAVKPEEPKPTYRILAAPGSNMMKATLNSHRGFQFMR